MSSPPVDDGCFKDHVVIENERWDPLKVLDEAVKIVAQLAAFKAHVTLKKDQGWQEFLNEGDRKNYTSFCNPFEMKCNQLRNAGKENQIIMRAQLVAEEMANAIPKEETLQPEQQEMRLDCQCTMARLKVVAGRIQEHCEECFSYLTTRTATPSITPIEGIGEDYSQTLFVLLKEVHRDILLLAGLKEKMWIHQEARKQHPPLDKQKRKEFLQFYREYDGIKKKVDDVNRRIHTAFNELNGEQQLIKNQFLKLPVRTMDEDIEWIKQELRC